MNSSKPERTNLEMTEDLFAFLQGDVPAGCHYIDVPHLTAAQAWTVIHHLGNLHWQVPDFIERCACGDLFDSELEGDCLDYGEFPFHFCGACCYGPEAEAKRASRPEE